MTHDELREAVARIVAQGKCKYMPEYTAEEWEGWRQSADRILALFEGAGGLREWPPKDWGLTGPGGLRPVLYASPPPAEPGLRADDLDALWCMTCGYRRGTSSGQTRIKCPHGHGELVRARLLTLEDFAKLTRAALVRTPPQKPAETVATPNAVTRKVMEETEAGVNVVDFGNIDDLMDDLDGTVEKTQGDTP